MVLDTIIDTEQTIKRTRRIFAPEFKQHLVELCQQPDTSVAKVAMQHQVNANLLHKWIRQSRSMPPALETPSIPQTDFLPVIVHPTPVKQETSPPPVPEKKAVAHIRIPLHKEQGSARDQMIEIDWPVESAKELLPLIQGLIK
ncbi:MULTISPECIES: transposase [unclassified Acinetobacter]|uniref:IS66-like element accessory protein TnpA n=1 Tax=unclassified Acinetobacter TaxID=196816 RepID=UPI001C234BF2|nr:MULTISPECIES: transposase [unclassified Acinetobacter]